VKLIKSYTLNKSPSHYGRVDSALTMNTLVEWHRSSCLLLEISALKLMLNSISAFVFLQICILSYDIIIVLQLVQWS
jgi:hypothetical protein